MLKVKYVFGSWLPPLLGASAVIIFNRIYFANNVGEVPEKLFAHEHAHVKQIDRLGVFTFYYLYFKEYVKGRLIGKKHWEAYNNISFEIEARKAERRIL
jgi:hypothetical protein